MKLLHEIVMPNFPRQVKLSESRRAQYFIKDKVAAGTQILPMNMLIEVNELASIVANPLITKIYRAGKKLPERTKYFVINPDKFAWKLHKKTKGKTEERLYDLKTKEYVIKNHLTAGTPNWEIINGQKMYDGTYHPHTRNKIMEEIHQYMIPFLQGLTPIMQYPIIIKGYMYDRGRTCEISKGKMWDVGNRQFPYNKGFEDMLQHCKIIVQDDFEHIVAPTALEFVNLDHNAVSFEHCKTEDQFCRTLVYQIYAVNS